VSECGTNDRFGIAQLACLRIPDKKVAGLAETIVLQERRAAESDEFA
jgi:hypothetical protein